MMGVDLFNEQFQEVPLVYDSRGLYHYPIHWDLNGLAESIIDTAQLRVKTGTSNVQETNIGREI
jgi:hypothetical protein